jgi:hypothetical protein
MTTQSSRPARWSNTQGSDEWHLEIEHDRFKDDEPFVVSIWVEGTEEDGVRFDSLVTATPEQAREMADALRIYADQAEAANARVAAGHEPGCGEPGHEICGGCATR